MTYTLKLINIKTGDCIDSRKVTNDKEMFEIIGRFGVWYFLALDQADYEDAWWYENDCSKEEQILHFTIKKPENDRHHLIRGVLAIGKAWWGGEEHKVRLTVEQTEEESK